MSFSSLESLGFTCFCSLQHSGTGFLDYFLKIYFYDVAYRVGGAVINMESFSAKVKRPLSCTFRMHVHLSSNIFNISIMLLMAFFDRATIEEAYSRSMTKLAKSASNYTQLG